ncbi:ribose transport system ATP-binding protein [Deinobacterium chartae]|uniref:Ribose transport system ATP-binding protein n=1 Tax=Deinobacterium chartae TaxID=521158 RepID=A0A841HY11_9DEIO|nr:sugar ABC transporter ATP-binding protein [Deinobacterium chartae]MBB6096812.1 ribose transport system ATP-binding protein [Deinobacterium chartae]
MNERIAFENITKSFGPVEVLHGVGFSAASGEVHAVIGENGAGKSTLMKILCGYQPPSGGTVRFEGQPVRFASSRDAEALGIVLIHQEFNLAEDLSVADNIYLGRETGGLLLDEAAMRRGAAAALERVGVRLDPRTRVRDLSVPQKQLVEIAKAVSRDAQVLVMDEPTATLTPHETETLFTLIAQLRRQGVTVLYISHKLDEVAAISDRVTVLRDGRHVTTRATAELTQHEMANLMVGRELEDMFPTRAEPGADTLLEVEDLTVPGWAHSVSFVLRRGEVLGFAGLVGAGRTETFEGLLGLRRSAVRRVTRAGRPVRIATPQDAARHGVVYLSEDRKGKGLITEMALRPNLTLMTLEHYARPLLDTRAEQRALEAAVRDYGIRSGNLEAKAGSLSGGNQQKLALAKILATDPEVVILDEPTRGVDVGAKREIYHLIQRLARSGKGVIVISSELPELLGLCHRVAVMHGGRVAAVLEGSGLGEHEVIQYATGLKTQDTTPRRSANVHPQA